MFVYKLTSCSVSLISFSNVSNMTWGDSSCLTCWRTGTQSPRALIIYWNKLGWQDIKQGPTAYPIISGQWNRGLILHHVWFKITKITKHLVFDVKTIGTPTKIAKSVVLTGIKMQHWHNKITAYYPWQSCLHEFDEHLLHSHTSHPNKLETRPT